MMPSFIRRITKIDVRTVDLPYRQLCNKVYEMFAQKATLGIRVHLEAIKTVRRRSLGKYSYERALSSAWLPGLGPRGNSFCGSQLRLSIPGPQV
jgi:hypothetical protein